MDSTSKEIKEKLGSYRVERMADGRWDAYLPGIWPGVKLWWSLGHSTRRSAIAAVRAEDRRQRLAVDEAVSQHVRGDQT